MHDGLERFVTAQATSYATALAEVLAGRKRTHWMWYVFPQLAGLGRSATAQHYAIADVAEARAYLAHPILGSRLHEISTAVLELRGHTAYDVFGSPDDLKLRSCMTLFAHVAPPGSVYAQVLAAWFYGQPDPLTQALLAESVARGSRPRGGPGT